jgi:hypothetical protein
VKYDATGLLVNAARSLARKDGGTAYALAELAENLRKVVAGEATLDDFRGAYVVSADPIDPAKIVPLTKV